MEHINCTLSFSDSVITADEGVETVQEPEAVVDYKETVPSGCSRAVSQVIPTAVRTACPRSMQTQAQIKSKCGEVVSHIISVNPVVSCWEREREMEEFSVRV